MFTAALSDDLVINPKALFFSLRCVAPYCLCGGRVLVRRMYFYTHTMSFSHCLYHLEALVSSEYLHPVLVTDASSISFSSTLLLFFLCSLFPFSTNCRDLSHLFLLFYWACVYVDVYVPACVFLCGPFLTH